jgi:hypothetical protein
MNNIANILQAIESQSDALLRARFREPYRRAAEHDVRDFLQEVRPDLENWVRELQNGEIDRTDFANLASSLAPLLKEGPSVTRARTRARGLDSNGTEKLSEILQPYLRRAVQAWTEGLKAKKVGWNPDLRRWEEIDLPDHEVRRRCALHIIEFAVGKAIERSLEVSGNYKELSTLLDEFRQSPEAQRILGPGFFGAIVSEQSTAEGKDSAPPPESEIEGSG